MLTSSFIGSGNYQRLCFGGGGGEGGAGGGAGGAVIPFYPF